MKQFAVVVVILIVMAAGIPPVVGTLAQNHLTQQANIISENELLAVNVRAYERGWLTSSLLVDVELSGAYQERLAEILRRGGGAPGRPAGGTGGCGGGRGGGAGWWGGVVKRKDHILVLS